MATILTKKSDTSSSVPLAADLTNAAGGAELAVNTADKRLYSKTSGGSVVELGTNPSLMVLPSATSQPSGSANGVPYLNGSKVLTSGSALVFDGTKLGIGSAPAATSGRSVDLDGVSLQPLYTMRASGLTSATTTWTLDNANSLVTFDSSSSWPFRWVINSSEQMRLTSTGLGIGTSSPAYKLDVAGTVNVVNGSNGRINIGATNNYLYGDSSGNFIVGTSGSDKLQLTSSGNLGLGVTPSAWSAYKVMQISGVSGVYANGSNEMGMFQNAYYNGGWKYGATGVAAAWSYQYQGQHVWQTAPSGTAGNAISFTQAMTLDASGNLLVGGTTSSNRLTVTGNGSSDVSVFISPSGGTGVKFTRFAVGAGAGTEVGSVSYNGSTGVNYNTTSDYRLKTVIGAVSGAGARIDALEPIEYEWKVNGERTRGFLAHKFQEVYAGSVTGTKDAVDKEGNPVYQAMQASSSEVIADLVAEIQSLRKRLAALESK